jgi:hypothetical protein
MPTFEAMLVKMWNEYYEKEHIAAMAYKLPMVRFQHQGFDIYTDSRHYEYYTAVECKSIDAEKEQKLYFSQYFHHVKGVHQLEYENNIIQRSGRVGFLAVELRRRRGVRKTAFLVPWRVVIDHYESGDVGLEADEIVSCLELDYTRGGYHLLPDVAEEYVKRISGKPTSKDLKKVEANDWHTRESGINKEK